MAKKKSKALRSRRSPKRGKRKAAPVASAVKKTKVERHRAMWSGAIAFGLVNIPVKAYSGADDQGLDLDMLHKDDLSPIRYARVCVKEGKEIPYNEIVKGFKVGADKYVVLTKKDFESANIRRTKTIDIFSFVEKQDVDFLYYQKPYFLEPSATADRAYALLYQALEESNKAGVARFVFRNRERIGLILPFQGALVLTQLRYHEQLRGVGSLNLPKEKAQKQQLSMALSLIDALSGSFEPEKYRDEYQADLERLIAAKAKGVAIEPVGEAPEPTKITDLVEKLRQSLEGKTPPTRRKGAAVRRKNGTDEPKRRVGARVKKASEKSKKTPGKKRA